MLCYFGLLTKSHYKVLCSSQYIVTLHREEKTTDKNPETDKNPAKENSKKAK